MSIQDQLRRGTASENAAFTGAEGEPAFLTDKKRIAVHDGSTVGGILLPNATDILKQTLTRGTAAGTDTYTLTLDGFPTAYADGQRITVTFTNANTGASTLNVNGIAAAGLKDSAGSALAASAIGAGDTKELVYHAGSSTWRLDAGTSVSGGFIGTQIFTASGTYTKTTGISRIRVTVVGGGGGGGGVSGANGGNGGTSSFGSHCSATGGTGGVGTSGSDKGAGGTGGAGSSGNINFKGSPGSPAPGQIQPSGGLNQFGGHGGASSFSGGGDGQGSATGLTADGYGGGGGGAANGSTGGTGGGGAGGTSIKVIDAASVGSTETVTIGAAGAGGATAGGAGSAGIVIVEEFR